MQCPKCHSTMEPIAMAQANVHRCEGCRGLWFEMVDHETLKDRAAELDLRRALAEGRAEQACGLNSSTSVTSATMPSGMPYSH